MKPILAIAYSLCFAALVLVFVHFHNQLKTREAMETVRRIAIMATRQGWRMNENGLTEAQAMQAASDQWNASLAETGFKP